MSGTAAAIEELAHALGHFRRDPVDACAWYLARFKRVAGAEPNPAHRVLVALEDALEARGASSLLLTQNIDGLHHRAGSRALIKIHGNARKVRCASPRCPEGAFGTLDFDVSTFEAFREAGSAGQLPRCPQCGDGLLRPHVLWFDEHYQSHPDYGFERVLAYLPTADLVLFVGTSFSVGITDWIVEDTEEARQMFDRPIEVTGALRFRFPNPALEITVSPLRDPAARDRAHARFAEYTESRSAADPRPQDDDPKPAEDPTREALRGLATQRPALVRLADRTRARLTRDLALIADDALVAELAERALEEWTGTGENDDATAMALERTALRVLAPRLDELPPAIQATLVVHIGAPARPAAPLEQIAAATRDLADLDRRLIEENRRALSDPDATDRVRAYDWLSDRELAPADFDPLGSLDERRRALRAERERRPDAEGRQP